jgi:hypothetical protein
MSILEKFDCIVRGHGLNVSGHYLWLAVEGGVSVQNLKVLIQTISVCAVLSGCTTTQQDVEPPKAYPEFSANTLTQLGYDPIALPSTAFAPGSLVTSSRGSGLSLPLRLSYLCRPDFVSYPPLIVDQAASSDASRGLSGNFSLDLNAIGIGSAGLKAKGLRSVTLKFSNVRVEQLAIEDLITIRNGLGPVCSDLLKDYSQRGLAYQTRQALRADVEYVVDWSKEASAEVKSEVISEISGSLGAGFKADNDNTVIGKGLYYGMILDRI